MTSLRLGFPHFVVSETMGVMEPRPPFFRSEMHMVDTVTWHKMRGRWSWPSHLPPPAPVFLPCPTAPNSPNPVCPSLLFSLICLPWWTRGPQIPLTSVFLSPMPSPPPPPPPRHLSILSHVRKRLTLDSRRLLVLGPLCAPACLTPCPPVHT